MRERPILFSAPMVRAILAGTKTQTRRIKKTPDCPYGFPGDILWVRETWSTNPEEGPDASIIYRADSEWDETYTGIKWHPSIFMPRAYSRFTLKITSVCDERLQDITNEDAIAEGTPDLRTPENNWDMRRCYRELWESINGKGSWDKNPLVWVIFFMRKD